MIRGLRLWKRPLALALSLLAVWVLWAGLVKAHNVVLLGFLAILIAAMFWFPVGWFSHLMPRAAAVVLTLALTLGLVGGVVAIATPVVVEQGKQLFEGLPEATRRAEAWLRRAQRDKTVRQLTNGKDVAGMVKAKVPEAMGTVANLTPMALGHVVELVSTFVLLLVLAAFLVYRPSLYGQGIRSMLPRSFEPAFDELWPRLGQGLRGWVGGTLIAMFLMGSVTAAGLFFAGIQGWALLGLLTFLGTFVPYVGAVSSSVPGLLIGLCPVAPPLLAGARGVPGGARHRGLRGAALRDAPGGGGQPGAAPLLPGDHGRAVRAARAHGRDAAAHGDPDHDHHALDRAPPEQDAPERRASRARAARLGSRGPLISASLATGRAACGGCTRNRTVYCWAQVFEQNHPAPGSSTAPARKSSSLVRAGMTVRHQRQVVPSGSSTCADRRFRKRSMVRAP